MSLLERGGAEGIQLLRRLRATPPDDVATTIISYEEQLRGWLARIASAKTTEEQLYGYQRLKVQLRNYCHTAIVDYDEKSASKFVNLQRLPVRIGTMDLKIAAIALAHDAVILTCNRRDFEKVPGLRIEDWTQ